MRLCVLLMLASISCAARAEQPVRPSLFDPARHMRVSEVHPGMKGYGLSVFEGTRIDRFDVEVLSVLKNFNPKYDVVLIRCHGANLEHTGAIAGMSGSPIYLTDDQGRSRMIGAFAYGWSLIKDPLAGVQPIEYMLEVGPAPADAAAQPGSGQTPAHGKRLFRIDPSTPMLAGRGDSLPLVTPALTGPRLQPLATPLMAAGISPRLIEQFAPALAAHGLVALQTGGAGSAATTQPAELEPGSVLAAPLLTGDVELTAIGTCTEVLGDRVFGFGHPFNNEGPISLPMGAGQVNGVMPSLAQSFKLGAMTRLRGTLLADQAVGVAGRIGASPPTIPIDLHVIYADGSLDEQYHFEAAWHPRLTPLLSAVALASSLGGKRDLPQYHTVAYDLSMHFADGREVRVANVAAAPAPPALFQQAMLPINFASENPFARVELQSLRGTIRVESTSREAEILSVNLPKLKYRPGETLKAFVRYRPFRGDEAILPIELALPHDLTNGTYQLTICDQSTFLAQEQQARPFRFSAENINEVFEVLQDISSIRSNALYVRLMRQADGVAIGRTAMPLLPSSRRQLLLEAGRSNVTAFVSAAVKTVPTDMVITGSESFQIKIDAGEHVEVGGSRGGKPEPRGGATPVEPKPKPAKPETPEPAPKAD